MLWLQGASRHHFRARVRRNCGKEIFAKFNPASAKIVCKVLKSFPPDEKTLMMRVEHPLKENGAMTGIQFVTDDKGRKVAVQIDLKKYGDRLEDFWDGLVSESRRKEKGVPLQKVKADLIKRGRIRG